MSEQPAPEPGGWLAELQRARLSGGAAMTTFQGLLADEIVIAQSAADARDPALMVRAACDFAEDMLEHGFFLPGEFAPEALTSFYAQDYLRQALQGGHAQYFANRRRDELAVKCVDACLKSMVADPHRDLFTKLIKLHTSPQRERRRLLKQMRARNVDAAMRDLDAKLAALEAREPLAVRHKMWLKSLRKVRILADNEARPAVEALCVRNPLRARRAGDVERDRAVLMRADPVWRAVKELCDMAGLRLVRVGQGERAPMRSVWAEGPDVRAQIWRVETMEGMRTAVVYAEGGWFKRYLAVLMEADVMLPRGSLSLSKAQVGAMAPTLLRRG
jgi:hypothetical protein